jgi:hypothetical protein
MSLANQVLDFADDTEKTLFRSIVSSTPTHLKTASVSMPSDLEKLANDEFALVVLTKQGSTIRKYPINDAGTAWLSAQYFEKTAHRLPPGAQKIASANLKRACALYGLQMTEKLASADATTSGNRFNEALSLSKTAAPVEIEEIVEDGSKHFYALDGHYAMPNPEFVKKAAAYFVQHEKGFSDAEDRHEFALHVLARAAELDVTLEQEKTLAKYASEGYGDILETQIRLREDLLMHKPEMLASLQKIASQKNSTAPEDFAKALFTLDKKASLDRYYEKGYIADAFKSTFEKRFTKQASGYSWTSDATGISVSEDELVKAASDKYDEIAGHFGPSVASQLKKHTTSIFDSLPVDAKEVVAKIAKGSM